MSLLKKISIGTAQFGFDYGVNNQTGQIGFNEAKSIIEESLRNDIRSIDTAIVYGNAESVIGKLNTKEFEITTKLPVIPDDEKEADKWVNEQIERSLTKLNRKSISAILFHNADILETNKGREAFKALELAKKRNLIENIGISIYDPSELPRLLEKYEFDIVQAPLNVFDRRLEEGGWIDKLHDLKIKIQVRSIFLQGLILAGLEDLSPNFKRWEPLFRKWELWLKDNNMSSYEACLSFVLRYQKLDKIIIGVDSIQQFRTLIKTIPQINLSTEIPNIKSDDLYLIDPTKWETNEK